MTQITIDANRIDNSLLKKLTDSEIGLLGLQNCGIGLYKGTLKTRCNGITRKNPEEGVYTFEGESWRLDFVAIKGDENRYGYDATVQYWAARIYDKKRERFAEYPMGITGCVYFR